MANININDLFAPATSGVTPSNPNATPSDGSWLAQLLANAGTLQLTTTAWQSGGMVRTMMAIVAVLLSQEDVVISKMAQGGFLDFAATGTVTVTNLDGTTTTLQVSPDPSIPGQNPNGDPTWVDELASSVYNVQRIGAQQATNTLAIANTTSNTYGPFAAGTYHVQNTTTGAGYTNQSSLTIAPANLVGSGVTAATNTTPIQVTTSTAHGLATGQSVYIAGVGGNTGANGFFVVTVVDSTHVILNGSSGTGAYTTGGTVNVCTTATFVADLAGPTGTATPGAITTAVTTLNGVLVDNLVAFFGQTYESNTALVARCRLKLAALSSAGPAAAYKYFALSASQILSAQTPPVQLSTPITRVLVQTSTVTGQVTVIVANAGGAVSGVSNLGVSGATNATPIVVTTASNHGLSTNNYVTISGVHGNSNANGTWNITVLSPTTFSLNGSTGNAAYTTGGVVEGGDLGEVDAVIQANAVPDDVTAVTQSAVNQNVAIVATVTVPLANVASYQTAVQSALTTYFANLPIGGLSGGVLSYNDVLGVLYAAGGVAGQPSYVVNVTLTLNGGTTDVTYSGPTNVMVMSPAPTITVTGV